MIDFPGKVANDIGKFIALGGRNPFQPQSFRGKTDELKEVLHHRHPLGRNEVTFSVMALPDMATGYENTVCPLLECLEDEVRRYSPAAHHADR